MAKWGEADPRWIVSEAQDGRNVGAWHWCVPKLPGLPMWRELPCRQLDRDGGLAIIRTEIEGVILFYFLYFQQPSRTAVPMLWQGREKHAQLGARQAG